MYTKKQRNKIYREALNLLPTEEFMCHALKTACGNWFVNINQSFPEFHLFEPENLDGCVWPLCRNDAWTHSEEFLNPRAIVLAFCIAMTEN